VRVLQAASSSSYNLAETLSTLRFGVRAKLIKNKAVQNKQLSIAQCRALVLSSKRQLAEYSSALNAWEGYAQKLEAVITAAGIALPEGKPDALKRRHTSSGDGKSRPSKDPVCKALPLPSMEPMVDRTNSPKATPTSKDKRQSLTEQKLPSPAGLNESMPTSTATTTESTMQMTTPDNNTTTTVERSMKPQHASSPTSEATNNDVFFSDDESAGSVEGFSIEASEDGADEFSEFLQFDDSGNDSQFSDFSDFSDDEAGSIDADDDFESEDERLRLQQQLTEMTEKYLRTRVELLEQKQQFERTRTLVADRAACENEDLKAALSGEQPAPSTP